MERLDKALLISLGITADLPTTEQTISNLAEKSEINDLRGDLIRACTERDLYKSLYESLLNKMMIA